LGATTGPPPYGDRIVLHNVLVSAGTLCAGLLGLAFQVVVSHRVPPAEYGAIFAIVTLLTLVGLPASALTLMMAREASRDRAHGHQAASAAMLHDGNRILLVVGLALAVLTVLATPLLGPFLNVRADSLLAAAVGLPFVLAFPLLIGDLQGEERFVAYSAMAAGQAAFKLVGSVLLGTLLGPIGIVLGISLASAVSYLLTRALLRRKLAIKSRAPWFRQAMTYLVILLPSTLALAVLVSADLLIVKHFFPVGPAGEYAAVVALSRGLFYGAAGVAIVLFPKVVFRQSRGSSGSRLVWLSLGLVVAGGAAGLAILSVGARFFLTAFAGAPYAGGASYLPWYAVGMTLLGAAAVLIATHQSRGERGFLVVLVPIALLEPATIVAFHQSLLQVAQVVDACMGALVVALIAQYAWKARRFTVPMIDRRRALGLASESAKATR
jgi:O-antigen/teichoic acid export membrane protein